MTEHAAWTAPNPGSYHFAPAPGQLPHHVNACTGACHERRAGWFAWCAEGATVDPFDDPNGAAPWA